MLESSANGFNSFDCQFLSCRFAFFKFVSLWLYNRASWSILDGFS